MTNDEKIQEIYDRICNRNVFLENDNEMLRRVNEHLTRENRILLDIINNKVNYRIEEQ